MKYFSLIIMLVSCKPLGVATKQSSVNYGSCKRVNWPATWSLGVAICEDDLARCYSDGNGISCVKKDPK